MYHVMNVSTEYLSGDDSGHTRNAATASESLCVPLCSYFHPALQKSTLFFCVTVMISLDCVAVLAVSVREQISITQTLLTPKRHALTLLHLASFPHVDKMHPDACAPQPMDRGHAPAVFQRINVLLLLTHSTTNGHLGCL